MDEEEDREKMMKNSKSIFFVLMVVMCASTMAKAEQYQPAIKQVRENAWVVTGSYFDEKMTVVETSIGLVVVDTLTHAPACTRAMKLIRKFTKSPVKYVINTHFDIDHYGGNQLFPDATIIGHSNCRNHYQYQFFDKKSNIEDINKMIGSMKAMVPGEDPASMRKRASYSRWFKSILEGFENFKFTPPTLFIKESKTIHSGNTEIRLLYFGPGHTDADIVVHFPREKILVAGDLVLGDKTIPVVHRIHGGNIINLISILDQIKKIAKTGTTIVSGHGQYTGIEALKNQETYLKQLISEIKRAQKSGLDIKAAKEKILMPAYRNHWLYEMAHQGNIETAWHQVGGTAFQK
jgi:glyoxylase-like metal-dependent hydrolase (beta-lactamase superfamily II)